MVKERRNREPRETITYFMQAPIVCYKKIELLQVWSKAAREQSDAIARLIKGGKKGALKATLRCEEAHGAYAAHKKEHGC